jgi:hypothetical protein
MSSSLLKYHSNILISFRGKKWEIPFHESSGPKEGDTRVSAITVGDIRRQVSKHATTGNPSTKLINENDSIKLIYKGKVLKNDDELLKDVFLPVMAASGKRPAPSKSYRIVASGVFRTETEAMNSEIRDGIQKAKSLVKDDLTEEGQRQMKQRKLQGQRLLQKAIHKNAQRRSNSTECNKYGFGRIETLPDLPNEAKAREILTSIASDPGIKACMAKHKWNVETLSEMYPEGQVGVTDACVMGLNRNKGTKIELRLRTDDMKGFRKNLSIREVLYHELAHNVHSDHNGEFFQLMRQIKRECQQMDWTQGNGISSVNGEIYVDRSLVQAGTYRLGGADNDTVNNNKLSPRERAGRAAIRRRGGNSQQCHDCDNGSDSNSPPAHTEYTTMDEAKYQI